MTETTRKVQDDLKESVHKIWLAGLGAMATAEEEGSKFFRGLVDKGETYEKRGKDRIEELREKVEGAADKAKDQAGSTWERLEGRFDESVASALRRLGVPSREEIATLTKRVEELTNVVEQMRPKKAAAAK